MARSPNWAVAKKSSSALVCTASSVPTRFRAASASSSGSGVSGWAMRASPGGVVADSTARRAARRRAARRAPRWSRIRASPAEQAIGTHTRRSPGTSPSAPGLLSPGRMRGALTGLPSSTAR
ncbi:hypothetical protein GCM10020000_28880 [Streptomyces olivoverticillatus]